MSPRAWATDDRSGFVGNHENLQWQMEWGGFKLYNKRILVYFDMYDRPQEQLRTLILPPDPQPLVNARPENYQMDEWTYRITQNGQPRYQMNGTQRVESNVQTAIQLMSSPLPQPPSPPPHPTGGFSSGFFLPSFG